MLARPPVCCRAVSRQIRAPADTIWITDEALSGAFQHFCITSKATRRHGSSVPGPLESRRRLGKRRMTNAIEGAYAPMQDFGALYGSTGFMNRTQWQWQAPDISQVQKTTTTKILALPDWLRDYIPEAVNRERSAVEAQEPFDFLSCQQSGVHADMNRFLYEMRTAAPSEIGGICLAFNQSFKQSITLGVVSGEMLASFISKVTKAIRFTSLNKCVDATRCMSFYQAIWDGIKACKVLQPKDFGDRVLYKLLHQAQRLTLDTNVLILSTEILTGLDTSHARKLHPVILAFVDAFNLNSRISDTSKLVPTRPINSKEEYSRHEAEIRLRLESIQNFVNVLANLAGPLNRDFLKNLLQESTSYVNLVAFNLLKDHPKTLRTSKYAWLSMVAGMPNISENTLVTIWSRVDPSDGRLFNSSEPTSGEYRLSLHQACDVIMNFWIGQGKVKDPLKVRALFETASKETPKTNPALTLLRASSQDQENQRWVALSLFRLLHRIGRTNSIYNILRLLPSAQITLSPEILSPAIKNLGSVAPRHAMGLLKMFTILHGSRRFLRLDGCPNIILAMIKDPKIHPQVIWGALGVPRYDPAHTFVSSRRLDNMRINCVHGMALAFAHAKDRPHQVAMRNVVQCASYLRRHGVPVSPELARAFSHVGIKREILEKNFIGNAKLEWILSIVAKGEGHAVAHVIHDAVNGWRQRSAELRRRNGNILRVGPID